jgi:hypothetical protein
MLIFINKYTIICGCVGKIAALLQAFGLSVGSCGLSNVLQCAVGLPLYFFERGKKQNKFIQFAITYQRAKFRLYTFVNLSISQISIKARFLHLLLTAQLSLVAIYGNVSCRTVTMLLRRTKP